MMNRSFHNVEAVRSEGHGTMLHTHMHEGNVDGLSTDQVDQFIADAATDHMKYYQDLKLNLPLAHP